MYEDAPPPPPTRPEDLGRYSFDHVEGVSHIKNSLDRADAVAATVKDPEGRFRAHPKGAEWIWSHHGKWDRDPKEARSKGDYFIWKQHWLDIPAELLMEVFTFEECLRLRHGSCIESRFGRWFDEAHPFLRKIMFAHWHYSAGQDWNCFVDHLEAFKRLRIDIPDFEVRVIYTRTINTCAWAWAENLRDLYLDASFGLLLYHKGEHVLTVGFAPSERGVLVAQAQLRQKKGNRFLYKLPKHYLDIALDILRDAFGDCLWLVTGESTVDAILKAYAGGNVACKLDLDGINRVVALYNRPLEGFWRDKRQTYKHYDSSRTFVRLRAKKSTTRKAA